LSIGSAQADPWGTLAVIVVAMSIGAYFITVNYAAFVTCLVITLVRLYAFTAPGGLDILLAYRLGENLLGAAVGRPGVAATVTPLIETLTTTIAALDRHPG
jgi:hypothetical protein